MLVEENTDVLSIPSEGKILFKDNSGKIADISPEQTQLFSAAKQNSYERINLYEKDGLENIIQVWLNKNYYYYFLQNKNSNIYYFEGAFEIQDRLLHTKDGLALWNTDEIDFEALSNGAILLLFEVPLCSNEFTI